MQRSPRFSLWSGLPGPRQKVLGSALLWRIADRKDAFNGDVSSGAAVEVFDAVFEPDVHGVDYEASDLLYGSEAYSSYAAEHFGGMGIPSTLSQLMDLQSYSSGPFLFLWYAAFVREHTR